MALLQTKDQEEFLYREVMLTQVVNLSLILLKYTPGGEHTVIYELFQDLLKKTAHQYSLAEAFTTMEGIQTLL